MFTFMISQVKVSVMLSTISFMISQSEVKNETNSTDGWITQWQLSFQIKFPLDRSRPCQFDPAYKNDVSSQQLM